MDWPGNFVYRVAEDLGKTPIAFHHGALADKGNSDGCGVEYQLLLGQRRSQGFFGDAQFLQQQRVLVAVGQGFDQAP